MDLGENEDSIMDAALEIIRDIDNKKSLKNGPLQIRTYINNLQAEIRIFISGGDLINFDLFKGWSSEKKT